MKIKSSKAKAFSLTIVFSISLLFITFWSNAFQNSTAYWVQSLGYFLLTYLSIDGFSKRIADINPWSIGIAVILGQLAIQIPARILDFWGCYGSLMIAISCIISTILAVFCYMDKKSYTFILSYIVLTLFNSFVSDMWSEYVLAMNY